MIHYSCDTYLHHYYFVVNLKRIRIIIHFEFISNLKKIVHRTIIEDLSIELWLDIFGYLNIRDRFNGFLNLNQQLNQLLFNYHYHISLKNNDEDNQYLLEHILRKLSNPDYVSSLRLENIKEMRLRDRSIAIGIFIPSIK